MNIIRTHQGISEAGHFEVTSDCFIVSQGYNETKVGGNFINNPQNIFLVSYLGMPEHAVMGSEISLSKDLSYEKAINEIEKVQKSFPLLTQGELETQFKADNVLPRTSYKKFSDFSYQNACWKRWRYRKIGNEEIWFAVPNRQIFWQNPNWVPGEWNSPRRDIIKIYNATQR